MGCGWLLHRVNPERNEKRYYHLGWGVSLLYPWAVFRYWGRIGGAQRQMITSCNSAEEAEKAAARLLERRLKNGYTLIKTEEEQYNGCKSETGNDG